jgi:hypothetical protein
MTLVTRTIVGAALLSLVLPIGSAWATVQMLTDAKAAGMPAKSCQYCHREAMPKNAKALNDRGKFPADRHADARADGPRHEETR